MSSRPGALLARFGFREPERAVQSLPSGWQDDPRWTALLEELGGVPDPDRALTRLRDLPPPAQHRALRDARGSRRLASVLGFSDHLASVLVRVDGLAEELMGAPVSRRESLRDIKDAGLVHIAAEDLAAPPDHASFVRTGRALSELADVCLDRAIAEVPGAGGLAVLAMGKYGGRELNYASDIDVLFVTPDGSDTIAAERCARSVMARLNGPPAIFRVDADLRPEGRDGPLVRSLDAYRAYYSRWAQVWEFQALIKCRAAAGDIALGRALMDTAEPFVWAEHLGRDAIEQIRALKARAEEQVRRKGLDGRQIKLGAGGIRDVEFAVQLIQLVHGRHRRDLRLANTLEALQVLGAEGYVGEDDAGELAAAYVFLRHCEHRLQLVHGRQTHTLPAKQEEREHLARGLGYRDGPGASALDAFERDWSRITGVVRELHTKLFYRPLLEAFSTVPVIGPSLRPEEARERLAALGFDRPVVAERAIGALTTGSSRHSKIMRAILPGLLAWLAETPDPDAGISRLGDLAAGLESLPHLLAMLRDEPPAAELLCRALGSGPVVGELLDRDPGLVAVLSSQQHRAERSGRDAVVREAVAIARRSESIEDASRALRRFKEGAWLRTATRDLAAGEDPVVFVEVARALSWVADACLEAALSIARREQDERTGGPPPGGFAVIGMGRLGGEELNHASDLDVVFAYEHDGLCPDGSEGRLYHTAVVERLSAILSAAPPIFRVDSELRPEGKSGPIVRSLDSFAQYYERWASTWEFQALTRARHCAGDEGVTGALIRGVESRVYPRTLSDAQVAEIRHMKARIERERVKARDDRRFHVKLGTGGLADVEFTVQLLQMRHGGEHDAVRSANTLQALRALREAGLVGSRDADWLEGAYLALNRIRNHLFLLRGLPTDVLPVADDELERLARSLGYGRLARSRLMEDYRRTTRRARQVCDRLFYGEEE